MVNIMTRQCMFIGTKILVSKIPNNIYILVSKIPNNTTIHTDNSQIEPSDNVKNLGLYFYKYMSSDAHIMELSKKVSGILMYIKLIIVYKIL